MLNAITKDNVIINTKRGLITITNTNNSPNLTQIITSIRDAMGVGNVIASLMKANMLEALISEKTLNELAEEFRIDQFFLEPILELMSAVGLKAPFEERQVNQSYVLKMLAAFSQYAVLAEYIQKARGEPIKENPLFNQAITSASSRLAEPAVSQLVSQYHILKEEKIKILDIGCGLGAYLIELAKRNPGLTGCGLEMDQAVAKKAEINVKNAGLIERIRILAADFQSSNDIIAAYFDVVMMNHIYHFVGEEMSVAMTKKSKNYLKKGGYLLVLELCKNYPEKEALLPILFDIQMRHFFSERKAKAFTREEIEEVMKKAGYKLENPLPLKFDSPNMVYFIGRT